MVSNTLSTTRLDAGCILDPDYSRHPAYGRMFADIPWPLRLKAVARVIPWMLFIAAKRCFFGDRLPHPPGQDAVIPNGVAGRIRIVPGYLRYALRNAKAFLPRGRCEISPAAVALAGRVESDGIATGCLPPEHIAALRSWTESPLAMLLERVENNPANVFEETQRWLDRDVYRVAYRMVEECLERAGAIAAASLYLGRRASVVRLLVQVNDRSDTYFYSAFSDAGIPDPPTHRMHLDTTYGVMKCMIYLSEVSGANGPFCYVLGSHRLRQGRFEGLVRRAVDRSGLSLADPASRRLFTALPSVLRRKSAFGTDCLAESETAQRLLESEYRWTSKDGNFALFDNLGVHRGATVREGQRRALFAILG